MAVRWSFPPSRLAAAAGPAVTAAALTAGTPLADGEPPVIPGGLAEGGMKLRLAADIEVTSTSATPTLIAGFYLGAVGGAIGSAAVLGVTGALVISASATAWLLRLSYLGSFRTFGSGAGVIYGAGESKSWINVGITGAPVIGIIPQTAALRTVSTLNLNQNNQLDVGLTLSSVTGSPSCTVQDFAAELIG
jgi:hypothetical protein